SRRCGGQTSAPASLGLLSLLSSAALESPKTSKMEPPFHAEFVRGVQGFIEADSLPGSHMIHRKRHRLTVHRRGTDVPVHVKRLRRPVSGDLIFRTRAERPSSGLG